MSANLTRAQQLLDFERFDEAEKLATQAIGETPEDPVAHVTLSRALTGQKGRNKEAVAAAEMAIGLAPAWDFAHYVRGYALYRGEKYQQARESLSEAISLDPEEPGYYFLLGWLDVRDREWQKALDLAETGLSLDAESVDGNNLRATCLRQLNRMEEAGLTLDAALHRSPEDSTTHTSMGWTLLQQGDHAGSLKHFQEALRLDPTSEYAREGLIEALKARSPIYRTFLKYLFFMSRQTEKMQWAIIIGGFIGYRLLSTAFAANERTAFLVPWIIGLWLLLVITSWAGSLIFDIALLVHPIGKHALSRQAKVAAALGFVAVLSAAGLAIAHPFVGVDYDLLFGAGLFVATLLPLSGLSWYDKRRNRMISSAVAGLVAICAIGAALGHGGLGSIGILTVVAFSWFGNLLATSER